MDPSRETNTMNEAMKVLTPVATAFMLLTFAAEICGINFDRMPEPKWRYSYAFVWLVKVGGSLLDDGSAPNSRAPALLGLGLMQRMVRQARGARRIRAYIADVVCGVIGGARGKVSPDVILEVGFRAGIVLHLPGMEGPLLLGRIDLPEVVDTGVHLRHSSRLHRGGNCERCQ